MMSGFKTFTFPKSRIATNDICTIGIKKHHVAALIEIDVTDGKEKIKLLEQNGQTISITAWLIKVISDTIKDFDAVSGYVKGKRSVLVFDDINVSIAIEKDVNGHKVPIPLIIQKANERSVESISVEIKNAKDKIISGNDIVLHQRTGSLERIYYSLPGFARRLFWRYLLGHPQTAFKKMGNVAVTSVGMIATANGWFIPISVHPLCFGIGRIARKPVVLNETITIRDVLNMTVLLDHDVVDGAVMARFIGELTQNIEKGMGL